MYRRSLKLAGAFVLLAAAWLMPAPSESIPLYLTCETYCCWGYGTASSLCTPGNGVVMTCGQWWQRTQCP